MEHQWEHIAYRENVKEAETFHPLPLSEIYAKVREVGIKNVTDKLNHTYSGPLSTGFKDGGKTAYQNFKASHFPVAMFSLNDVDRHSENKITAQQHTRIINLDLDQNTKAELIAFRGRLPEISYIQFCALSVSGKTTGYLWANILVEIPDSFSALPPPLQKAFSDSNWIDSLHKLYIRYVTSQFLSRFHIIVGEAKDLKRARYIGYDETPYHNEEATQISLSEIMAFFQSEHQTPEEKPSPPPPQQKNLHKTVSSHVKKAALETLEKQGNGLFDDRSVFINFAMACKQEGLTYEEIDSIVSHSQGYNKIENIKIWEGIKPNGSKTFGSVVHLARQVDADFFKTRRKYHTALETEDKKKIPDGVGLATKMALSLTQEYKFSYNELTGKVHVNGKPITDPIFADIYCNMVDQGFKNSDMMKQVLLKEAVKQSYHPLYQYFKELKWDRKQRLESQVLSKYFQDKDEIFWWLLRGWMIGAIEKVRTGKQNPMLVLAGSQGVGKSVFVQWLCPIKELYLDSSISPDYTDDNLRLTDRFIWEVSELGATTRRQDVEALKAFLSREIVTVRRPYDRYDTDKKAMASFIGTINDDGCGFLNDTTGHRRFRVCHMTHIDWSYAKELQVDQLWAEALYLYKAGETNKMDAVVNEIMQGRIKESFEYVDPIEEIILDAFELTGDAEDTIKTIDALDVIKQYNYRGANTKAESMALSRAMKKLGIEKKRMNYGRLFVGLKYKPRE
ncbi:MAG: hypothetical protein GY797_14425 [Deltaproteobacteria bacterium]|nr:hypothetical protein [Deltaproteobacteria bacterium]